MARTLYLHKISAKYLYSHDSNKNLHDLSPKARAACQVHSNYTRSLLKIPTCMSEAVAFAYIHLLHLIS